MIPKPSETYGPRKHPAALSRAVQSAWECWQRNNAATPADTAKVAARLCEQVKALYPVGDMEILDRYKMAGLADHVRVAIHNGQEYSQTITLELPEPVRVAGGQWPSLWACGPDWGPPDYGLTPDGVARLSSEERGEHVAYCEARARRRVPRDLDPYFAVIVAGRQAFTREYRAVTDWPTEARKELGRWPLWQEIAGQFPDVFGPWLERQWRAAN